MRHLIFFRLVTFVLVILNLIEANLPLINFASVYSRHAKENLLRLRESALRKVKLRRLWQPEKAYDDEYLQNRAAYVPGHPILRQVQEVEHEEGQRETFNHLANHHCQSAMLLHEEFLHVEAVDGDTATEADPKEEDANVGLVQLLHVEHPKVDRQLDELADDDWPLTAVQVCQTHDREHRDDDADEVH